MGIERSLVRRVATVGTVLFGVVAFTACSEAKEGNDANPILMGGMGAVGGGVGGVGGAAGIAGGTAGMGQVGGMGAIAGMGGIGGMAGVGGIGGMAGVGGMAGAGGVGGEGGMGGTGGEPVWEDKGMGDGSDVVTIGDSWMRLNPTEGVELSLEAASGRDYRNYGVAGTMILDGAIPRQLSRAVSENPNIKTVVMTGGGNDILIGNIFCTVNWADSCNDTVHEVAAALAELRVTMAEAGVEDVIIVGYDYIPNMVVKPGLDLSIMLSLEMCKPDEMPRCHFLNNANVVSSMIRGDGIHPTAAGYALLGERVWAMMEERGLRR